jgi:integrase
MSSSGMLDNVADHASPPRGEPTEMQPLTPVEVARLLESVANDPPLHLYLTLAATTGARRGQLLALRWTDVDLIGGSFRSKGPQSRVLTVLSLFRPRPLARVGLRSIMRAVSSCGTTTSEESPKAE